MTTDNEGAAWYVVDSTDWDEAAGPTGYEHAHVWYGPLDTRELADELADGSMEDDAVVVEMDEGQVFGAHVRELARLRSVLGSS